MARYLREVRSPPNLQIGAPWLDRNLLHSSLVPHLS